MLNVISTQQAAAIVDERLRGVRLDTENVALDAAPGRVTAGPVVSRENVPAFDRSVMDGYAVRAADTFGAGDTLPAMLRVAGEIRMGEAAAFVLSGGECAKIPTGGMLPEGADAVVPVEYTDEANGLCLCYRAVSPRQYVTAAGDDVAAGQTLFAKGTRITPAAVGVLAAMGFDRIPVVRRPRVGILSTGDELVPVDRAPRIGEVRNVNGPMLHALCASYGCECVDYGILKDDEALLLDAVRRAANENDVVLISGGSSAGEADKTADVIARMGEVFCHGIAVKPGKPTVLGRIGDKAVFGLPGHPAACFFMTTLLVKRHIDALLGVREPIETRIAVLSEHVSSNHGREEMLCVRLSAGTATPVYGKSGVISQLCDADGYILIPRESEGLRQGSQVEVRLF